MGKDYIRRSQKDASYTDLMISGSGFFTNLCKTIFWYNGEVFECGTPRLDIFFSNNDTKELVNKKLGLDNDVKIILYAPTFRADHRTSCYDMDYDMVIDQLKKKYGGKWCVAIRMHPNIADSNIVKYNDRIINASNYPDLYELILASDVVISDYSSLIFEAGLIKKTVFLYVSDKDDYMDERGCYWNLEELPFPFAQNNDEMKHIISNYDDIEYQSKIELFYSLLNIKEDGHASERLAKRILKIIDYKGA